MFGRVAIIGLGLIGGSLGMALRRVGLAAEVVGVGRNYENLRLAVEVGAADWVTTDPKSGVAGAAVVVVAAPVSTVGPVITEIAPFLSPGTVVTDVGSTKAAIVRAVEPVAAAHSFFFVGGHPMAGSEKTGVRNADPYLFENAYYVLTPTPATDPDALEKVRQMAEGVGARVIKLAPEIHDFYVAAVSHLPHCVAAALVNTIGVLAEREAVLPLAAGGFRDTTRVAAGDAALWRDILLSNREAVLAMLGRYREVLQELADLLSAGDTAGLEEWLKKAHLLRQAVPAKSKGYLPELCEIVVTVPDEPGVIARLAGILGDAGINICDIEILRVREGEGGTIRLGFATTADQEEAVRLLREAGIETRKR
uniref:Prephenate dehydrogenase n=1 Tax=Ammonifex degensii TaxID=42838 RepID=A0A7C2IFF7_9THEO